MKVAYQGLSGAFAHQACLAALPDYVPVPEPTFQAVVDALVCERVQRAILPLENVEAGEVPGVRRLIEASPVHVVAEHFLPVRVHLLGLRGSDMAGITAVVSHPMALKQCRRTLARLRLGTETASNTAAAAASLRDPSKAALASEAAAAAYGLQILLRDVHDNPDNATRFAILARAGRDGNSAIDGGARHS